MKRTKSFLGFAALAAIAVLAPITAASAAKDEYSPDTTKVVVLPAVNGSNEKDPHLKAAEAAKGTETLRRLFAERGFNVIDEATVNRSLADSKIDLTDEDQQKKSTFYQVGQALNADLVAFAVVEQVGQHVQTGYFSSNRVGSALVKVWLLDVKGKTPIVNGASKEAKSTNGLLEPGWRGSSSHIVSAVGLSIQSQLQDFLKAYPQVTSESKTTHHK